MSELPLLRAKRKRTFEQLMWWPQSRESHAKHMAELVRIDREITDTKLKERDDVRS